MQPQIDLDDWNLSLEDLAGLSHLAQVSFHIRYPGYKPFIDLTPSERKKAIAAHHRRAYKQLHATLPNDASFQRLGTHSSPTGIQLQLQLNQLSKLLPELSRNEDLAGISIKTIEGLEPKIPEPEAEAFFWNIQARFAIQIENATKGLQTYEDRWLLIKANSAEEAQQKLLQGFESYAEPYLNPYGLLVCWQFEAFIDSYPLTISSPDDFLNEQGVEILSKLGSRRLRPGHEWTTREK